MTAEIIAWLVAIGSAVAALVGVFLKGQATGAARERNRQLEQQVRATTERANADRDAGRAADPVGELQRDWRRG